MALCHSRGRRARRLRQITVRHHRAASLCGGQIVAGPRKPAQPPDRADSPRPARAAGAGVGPGDCAH